MNARLPTALRGDTRSCAFVSAGHAAAMAAAAAAAAFGSVAAPGSPGDVVVADQGDRLGTLLGSCVAVVLTDPRRTVGAMCHIVHAGGSPSGATSHGEPAFDAMRRGLQRRGIVPALCEARVYGGGNMFPALVRGRHVGEQNVAWVLERLAREGIRVAASDVGGTVYRRVDWTVGPGEPTVRAQPI
ncbi:chemotaxis protein CheD [Piscinibacter sakaiensis]|uniref:chemotaxis protein CheD n=1 Tax=Piscinibacter sakaiensis TaxID=1547922 RepID=UPI003728113F